MSQLCSRMDSIGEDWSWCYIDEVAFRGREG
jgi:hypothetical protein